MKICSYFVIVVLLVGILALPASTDHRRKLFSSTKEVLLNGRRYLLDRSAGHEISHDPYFQDALREVEGPISSPLPVPNGLLPQHVVKLLSEAGPVALAVGTMDLQGRGTRNRLSETGWECIRLPATQEGMTVATMRNGKEASIVLLDEKTGQFLLVRKPE